MPSASRKRGPLETRYLQVHPGATTGLDLCRWFERRPNEWFTHAQIKAALGCSDRIIREHVPAAVNEPTIVLDVDMSQRAWRYRYRPERGTAPATEPIQT